MIKEVLVYLLAFSILLFVIHFGQAEIFKQMDSTPRFNYWKTNAFFAGVSAFICINLKWLSNIESLKHKIGYIYLTTIFIKAGLFFIAFNDSVFSLEKLTTSERLSLLISLLVFLILEVFFITKILRENHLKI